MSKRINVNPSFYKVGGREPTEGPDEAVVHKRQKQEMKQVSRRAKKAPAGKEK